VIREKKGDKLRFDPEADRVMRVFWCLHKFFLGEKMNHMASTKQTPRQIYERTLKYANRA
jgi:hypothetical protein